MTRLILFAIIDATFQPQCLSISNPNSVANCEQNAASLCWRPFSDCWNNHEESARYHRGAREKACVPSDNGGTLPSLLATIFRLPSAVVTKNGNSATVVAMEAAASQA